MKRNGIQLAAFSVATLPLAAVAHSGDPLHSGFWSGFSHPFTGADHIMPCWPLVCGQCYSKIQG